MLRLNNLKSKHVLQKGLSSARESDKSAELDIEVLKEKLLTTLLDESTEIKQCTVEMETASCSIDAGIKALPETVTPEKLIETHIDMDNTTMLRQDNLKAKHDLQEVSSSSSKGSDESMSINKEFLKKQPPISLRYESPKMTKHHLKTEIATCSIDDEIKELARMVTPEKFVETQIYVNNISCRYTFAECAFLVFPTRDEDILYLRVMGGNDIGPTTFSIPGSAFEKIFKENIKEPSSDISEAHSILFRRLSHVDLKTFMCIPYFHPEIHDTICFLICVINKKWPMSGKNKNLVANAQHPNAHICGFTQKDEVMLGKLFKVFGPMVLKSVELHKDKVRLHKRSKIIELSNTKTSVEDLSKHLSNLMIRAKYIMCAKNCSLFIIDSYKSELIAKIFDLVEFNHVHQNVRFSMQHDIYGKVAKTGTTLIKNEEFGIKLSNRATNEESLAMIKNLICFPIKYRGKVFAVGEFSNKIGDDHFNADDEELCEVLGEVIKKVFFNSVWDHLKL